MAARVVPAVRKHISAARPAEEETKAVRVVHIDCRAVPLMTASGERARELEGALQQRFLHEDRGFFLPFRFYVHFVSSCCNCPPKKRLKVPSL